MSKNMMYIAPFFALTGLYWQYGLVIYWVTTNVWTLGQQHILFRNLPIVGSTGVPSAASASNGPTVRSAPIKSSLAAAKANGGAKAAAKPGTTAKPTTTAKPGTAAKPGTGAKPGTTSANGTAGKAKVPAAKAAASAASPAKSTANAAANSGMVSTSKSGNGRGLLGFGKAKQEPEQAPVVPETKVVRQQPVRQARSKRSGSSGGSGGSGTSGKR
jgi:hypothetical protein